MSLSTVTAHSNRHVWPGLLRRFFRRDVISLTTCCDSYHSNASQKRVKISSGFMLTVPLFALIGLAVLLALLAFCHFRQGRQHKDHASRKGPDDS